MSCEERKARMARNGDVISGIYEAVGSEFIWSHQEMPGKMWLHMLTKRGDAWMR